MGRFADGKAFPEDAKTRRDARHRQQEQRREVRHQRVSAGKGRVLRRPPRRCQSRAQDGWPHPPVDRLVLHLGEVGDGRRAVHQLHGPGLAGGVDRHQLDEVGHDVAGLRGDFGQVAHAVVAHQVDQLGQLAVDEAPGFDRVLGLAGKARALAPTHQRIVALQPRLQVRHRRQVRINGQPQRVVVACGVFACGHHGGRAQVQILQPLGELVVERQGPEAQAWVPIAGLVLQRWRQGVGIQPLLDRKARPAVAHREIQRPGHAAQGGGRGVLAARHRPVAAEKTAAAGTARAGGRPWFERDARSGHLGGMAGRRVGGIIRRAVSGVVGAGVGRVVGARVGRVVGRGVGRIVGATVGRVVAGGPWQQILCIPDHVELLGDEGLKGPRRAGGGVRVAGRRCAAPAAGCPASVAAVATTGRTAAPKSRATRPTGPAPARGPRQARRCAPGPRSETGARR